MLPALIIYMIVAYMFMWATKEAMPFLLRLALVVAGAYQIYSILEFTA